LELPEVITLPPWKCAPEARLTARKNSVFPGIDNGLQYVGNLYAHDKKSRLLSEDSIDRITPVFRLVVVCKSTGSVHYGC
jgi:hypothetical protein